MTLPPLDAAWSIKTLWAPGTIYEPGNPRQRRGLSSLYDPIKRHNGLTKAQIRDADKLEQQYALRRDLENALRGTSGRFAWDYQSEALTISDDEQEYEARQDAHRTYGYSSLVPVGKSMNQEAEADDEAINEEARAATLGEHDNGAVRQRVDGDAVPTSSVMEPTLSGINTEGEAEYDPEQDGIATAPVTRRRRSDRHSRDPEPSRPRSSSYGRATRRRSSRQSGQGAPGPSDMARRASGASMYGPPNSRDSIGVGPLPLPARAPPAGGRDRYSTSSSNGGGTSTAVAPRYSASAMIRGNSANGATAAHAVGAAGPSTGGASHRHMQTGTRDLDADIPEAEEASYGLEDSTYNGHDDGNEQVSSTDTPNDDNNARRPRAQPRSPSFPPSTSNSSETDEDRENAEQDQGDLGEEDMELSI